MATFAFLRGASLASVALMFGSALAVGLLACDDPESPAPDGPARAPSQSLHERPAGARGFAAAGTCAECHAVQQSAWQGSTR